MYLQLMQVIFYNFVQREWCHVGIAIGMGTESRTYTQMIFNK